MADPSAGQASVFRSFASGPRGQTVSFFTKALYVTAPAPAAPVETTIRVVRYQVPPRASSVSYLFDPTVIGAFVPPVVPPVPPDVPPVPPVITPDPPPVVTPPTPEDPNPDPVDGELVATPDVKGSLTLTPDPADATTITPNAGS